MAQAGRALPWRGAVKDNRLPMQNAEGRSVADRRPAAARLAQVTRNVRVVSLCTVVSRVLGMVRDAVMAATFGAGPVLDAFTLAFRLPNLARSLFGEGVVATAFLPTLVAELQHGGMKAVSRLTTALFATMAGVMCGLVLVVELALWGWGVTGPHRAETELLIRLCAILAPYLVLICLTAQLGAVLQATGEFFWPAAAPMVLNVAWLVSLWVIVPRWSDASRQIQVMSACVVAAGLLQLLLPVPAAWRQGLRLASDWKLSLPTVGRVFRQVLPVLLGLSITLLNSSFDSLVAWALSKPNDGPDFVNGWGGVAYPLPSGTTAALYFAQRLYQFPLGVFGVALGTVLYPLLSAHAQRGDWNRLKSDYALAVRLVAAMGLPASAGLVLLAEPLTMMCFRYGKFDDAAARQTAQMIAAYGAGVWAYCGLLIVQRGFYALGDRITPLGVGIGAFAVNVVLSLTSLWWLGGLGLALSTAVAAMWQCVVTGWLLARRMGGIDWSDCCTAVWKSLWATAVMWCAGWVVLAVLPYPANLATRVARVLLPCGSSVMVYFAAAAVLRFREPWELVWWSRSGEHHTEAIDDESSPLPDAADRVPVDNQSHSGR